MDFICLPDEPDFFSLVTSVPPANTSITERENRLQLCWSHWGERHRGIEREIAKGIISGIMCVFSYLLLIEYQNLLSTSGAVFAKWGHLASRTCCDFKRCSKRLQKVTVTLRNPAVGDPEESAAGGPTTLQTWLGVWTVSPQRSKSASQY